MRSQLNTILSFFILTCLYCFPLRAQISSSIVSPFNAADMADEVAFLYQAQLDITFSELSQFISDHPIPISSLVNCGPPLPKITHQDDQTITFRWPAVPGKKIIHWIRYLNMRTGETGITSTSANAISLSLPNDLYAFMFQRGCDGIGSNEYIIIDDKPISIAGGAAATDCICETSVYEGDSDNFLGATLSTWPTSENFVETYMVRVNAYFGESDFGTQPDMYSTFSFHAFGSNGAVSLIQYRNDCDGNAVHDYCSIFAIDENNTDMASGNGNESPAFLQFTFAEGIRVEPLGGFYDGRILVRKCVADNTLVNDGEVFGLASPHSTSSSLSTKPQVFPNPNLGELQLSYQLPQEEHVQIQLFNSYGQLLEILAEETQGAGPHQLAVDLSSFPVGAYYCRIQRASQAEGVWMIKQE